MSNQKELWKKINEPKIEKIIAIKKNSTIPELLEQVPIGKTAKIIDGINYMFIIDRIPKTTRKRKKTKNKKQKHDQTTPAKTKNKKQKNK
jgi:hypothetical protein